jgi:glucose-6-phosphate isomerase
MSAALRCDQTRAWSNLSTLHRDARAQFDLRDAFAKDHDRFAHFSFEAEGILADLSKNLIDRGILDALLELARECSLEAQRDAMFAGEPINVSETRAVLHTALRAPPGDFPFSAEVHGTLNRMLAFAESVRDPASGIRHIVNIGIGGSDLGPQMVVGALSGFIAPHLAVHFVSNVDSHHLEWTLRGLNPAETLFVIASKTFTTQETMSNAQLARGWFLSNGGVDTRKHFVACTTNVAAASGFGIDTTFGFRDWVGGRYSLWSSIGLPIAIAIGAERFRELLAGAHAMDRHFRDARIETNLPILLGLLDVWNRNFLGFASRSVAPYHQGLSRLPAYLQQLEMESNGKRVDRSGNAVSFSTSPVIWGEAGTNGQHAYFQMLHQGSDVIPVEFILVREPGTGDADAHRKLLANGLAQAQALMLGKSFEAALAEKTSAESSAEREAIAHQRSFPGNRPSTTLLIDALNPRTLGTLLAMYEHRTFVCGALWGINSFDQWGVELGKTLCNGLLPRFESGDFDGLDSSTSGLLQKLRQGDPT